MTFVEDTPTGCRIRVLVSPRASRARLLGPHGDALKLAVTAPPVDGAANAAVLSLLAEALGLPRAHLSLQSGHSSRRKVVVVEGLRAEQAASRLTS